MNRSLTRVALVALFLPAAACPLFGQQEVQELQRKVAELERRLTDQQAEFDQKLAEMQQKIDERSPEADNAINERINTVQKSVERLDRFYRRPQVGQTAPSESIFSALQGGLIFTGLFRTRFEARHANVDFSNSDKAIDDSGILLNGRFRLGFGAVLLERSSGGANDAQITALTEFQSVGSFANNSYLRFASSTQVPVPVQFNILTEPFEAVGLYQGYLAFQHIMADTMNVKVGRQEVVLGNELMLGNNSFADGTVHDAVVVQWSPSKDLTLTTLYSKESASDGRLGTAFSDFDEDELAAAYVETQLAKNLAVEGYGIYFDARPNASDIFVTGSTASAFNGTYTPPILGTTWTLGGRVLLTDISVFDGILSLNLEAAYQMGEEFSRRSLTGDTRAIHGWVGEALINYRIDPAGSLKPILALGYYYAQGGDGLASGDIGFQPLYVNRHFERVTRVDRDDIQHPYFPGGGRYGNMDQIPMANIHIAKFAGSMLVSEDIELGAGFLYAITADNEGWGTGVFGQEIDVFATYFYNENVLFSANASIFFPGETATAMSNALFFPVPTDGSPHAGGEAAFAIYFQAIIQF